MAEPLLKSENPDYPDVLPVIKPDWLTDTVKTLATQIADTRNWSALPVLADALQDAGCDDEDVLSHVRHGIHPEGDHGRHKGGCWQGECWVVNLLLSRPQRVLAAFRYPGMFEGDVSECPVLNPGDSSKEAKLYRGCTWLVESSSHSAKYPDERVIVETPVLTVAEEKFIDSPFGADLRITEPDLADYRVPQHDTNSKGEPHPDEWTCRWSPDGHPYDGEEVVVVDLNEDRDDEFVRYFGPGIRHGGVTPRDYTAGEWDCMRCERPIGYIRSTAEQLCVECGELLARLTDDDRNRL